MLFLGERFSALLTDEGPLSRVELAVRHQVTLQGKGFAALWTDERPLPGVDSRVGDQVML